MDHTSDSTLKIIQHILRRQSQHGKSSRRQPRIPSLISRRPVAAIVRLAVDLDRQPPVETGEVKHDLAQWMLPPEFEPAGPLAQCPPDQDFGQIAGPPLAFCQLVGGVAGGEHPSTTSLRLAVPLPVPGRFWGSVIHDLEPPRHGEGDRREAVVEGWAKG